MDESVDSDARMALMEGRENIFSRRKLRESVIFRDDAGRSEGGGDGSDQTESSFPTAKPGLPTRPILESNMKEAERGKTSWKRRARNKGNSSETVLCSLSKTSQNL